MEPKFLTEPALLIEPDNILVISDLHIGLEYDIKKSGITIPSQMKKLQEKLDKLIAETGAKHLIVLGDIKHDVKGISWQEYREIPEFFEHFEIKVSLIKGNHDGDIEKLVPPEIDIYGAKGLVIGDFAFIHGHAWPSKRALNAKYILMGHVHPAVEFWNNDFRSLEHCWLKCKVNKEAFEEKYKKDCRLEYGIIMPTFNHLTGGIAFNSKKFEPMGPLLTNNALDWRKSEVYLLDGTYLGPLNKLRT